MKVPIPISVISEIRAASFGKWPDQRELIKTAPSRHWAPFRPRSILGRDKEDWATKVRGQSAVKCRRAPMASVLRE